jgi:hypothetical protein
MIIGISGKKKSGKDTVANYLKDKFGYTIYHYADPLKEFCRDLLGLDEKLLWGTDEDKNTLTKYTFYDFHDIACSIMKIRNFSENRNYMSYREILQYFGTEVFRAFYQSIWVETTLRRIERDNCKLAVIADVRFEDEVQGILDKNGDVIRLLRNSGKVDEHKSETVLDGYNFKNIIDNRAETLEETYSHVDYFMYKILNKRG